MPRSRRPTKLTPEDAKFPLATGIGILEETRQILWQTMKTPADLSLYQSLGEALEKFRRAKQCLAQLPKGVSNETQDQETKSCGESQEP
jgi:hypothetical protein